MERQVRPGSKIPNRNIRESYRRRLLPPRGRPRRPDGRVGLRIGLLAVLGRGRPLPRARRGDGPLQGLLWRPDADRVGQPGGAGRGGRLRLAAVARLGPGRRPLLIHTASGLALDDRGQRTSEGNTVWLYEPNGGPAQAWLLAGPAIPRTVDDGSYRLAAALDARMAVSASASGCSLSSGAGALSLERDGATGLYRVSSGGLMLTESGNRAVLAEADGSASQLWRVSALGGGRYSFTPPPGWRWTTGGSGPRRATRYGSTSPTGARPGVGPYLVCKIFQILFDNLPK